MLVPGRKPSSAEAGEHERGVSRWGGQTMGPEKILEILSSSMCVFNTYFLCIWGQISVVLVTVFHYLKYEKESRRSLITKRFENTLSHNIFFDLV